MKSNPAPEPYCVKDPSKNMTHVWCVSVIIESSGKSTFIGVRLCIGTSAS